MNSLKLLAGSIACYLIAVACGGGDAAYPDVVAHASDGGAMAGAAGAGGAAAGLPKTTITQAVCQARPTGAGSSTYSAIAHYLGKTKFELMGATAFDCAKSNGGTIKGCNQVPVFVADGALEAVCSKDGDIIEIATTEHETVGP